MPWRPQMRSPALLQPMLQHGIRLGQQAEMVTDGLRALLLEAEGYATQVFEFVSLEHTSKNKMILAVKRGASRPVADGTTPTSSPGSTVMARIIPSSDRNANESAPMWARRWPGRWHRAGRGSA